MNKPKLFNPESPLWGAQVEVLDEELQGLVRALCTQGKDLASTEFLRGKISVVKTILDWGKPRI